MLSLRILSVAIAVAAFSSVSHTQGSATTAPDTVGTDRGTAKEAMEEAVPRSDTGTVVRSNESEAERAKDKAEEARDAAREARDEAVDAARSGDASQGTTSDGERSQRVLAPRADRN